MQDTVGLGPHVLKSEHFVCIQIVSGINITIILPMFIVRDTITIILPLFIVRDTITIILPKLIVRDGVPY